MFGFPARPKPRPPKPPTYDEWAKYHQWLADRYWPRDEISAAPVRAAIADQL